MENELTIDTPSYLDKMKDTPSQQDNFDAGDVGVPQIKLLQGMSGELDEHDAAKPGIFWHTGAAQSLGKSFTFVIAVRNKKALLLAPIEDGQGLLARAEDCVTWDKLGEWVVKTKDHGNQIWEIKTLDVAKSGLLEWGTLAPSAEPQSPPAATLMYDYLLLVLDDKGQPMDFGPAVMSLARSAIKKAKRGLNDKILMQRNAGRPMQAVAYTATAVKEAGPIGEFFNWQFSAAGFVSEDVFKQVSELSNTMSTFKTAGEGDQTDNPKPDNSENF